MGYIYRGLQHNDEAWEQYEQANARAKEQYYQIRDSIDARYNVVSRRDHDRYWNKIAAVEGEDARQ